MSRYYYVGSPQKTARSVYATVVHVSAQWCLQYLGEPLDAAKSRVQALYDAALVEARETQAQEARTWAPRGLDRGRRSDS